MARLNLKKHIWASAFSVMLAGAVTFVMLDTFVIQKTYSAVVNTANTASYITTASNSNSGGSTAVISEDSYQDENISIKITTVREYDTTFYVADIQVSNIAYLKTALASNTYGRNIKATTSDIAESNNAIFAVNGDYYGFRDSGFVLRNGTLYRETARKSGSDAALVIGTDGTFSIINESSTAAKTLTNAWQILSFGPALINNGTVQVTASSEVSQSMTSNPRTAIGMVSPLHYVFIVSDGRTSESEGLSLLQLANEMKERGCTVAYNLDGGGSSTMYFNGKVINNPTDGKTSSERQVSDIVYIGY